MIKLNLIADETAAVQEKKIKQKAWIFYTIIWLFSIFVLWFNYSIKQTSIETYVKEMTLLENKMGRFLPDFKHAMSLYTTHKQLQKKLTKIYNQNVEPAFLLESLQGISAAMPDNFWLEELKLNSLEKKEFDDNIKKSPGKVKALSLQGRVFFEQGDKGSNQVQKFVTDTKKYRPFYAAKTKLNLHNIKVGKKNQQYYYNFSVKFGWLDPFSL